MTPEFWISLGLACGGLLLAIWSNRQLRKTEALLKRCEQFFAEDSDAD